MTRLILLALGSLFAVTSAAAATPGVSDTEIKIGAHTPTSGPYAIYGLVSKGAQMYFDEVNAAGGVNGRKIKYLVEDDLGNPAKALEVTKKLVQQEQVFAFLLSLTPTHAAVIDFLKAKKVPDMFFGDPSAKSQVFDKFRFQALASASEEGTNLAKYIVKHFKGKKVAILAENSVSKEGIDPAKKILAGNNEVVAVELVEVSDMNLQPPVLKIKNAKADVILDLLPIPSTAAAIKVAAQEKFKVQWLVPSYTGHTYLTDMTSPEQSNGVIGQTSWENEKSGSAKMSKFVASWNKIDSETPPNLLLIYGYASADAFVEALKRAGKDLTREKLVAAAEGLKGYQCAFCLFPVNLSGTQHNLFDKMKYEVVKDGKWVVTE